jgi:ribonuclease T2
MRGARAGDFDFYVLALSWSAGFCELEGDRKDRDQCRRGAGLGFVLHGLWPQSERGYPVYCAPGDRNPPRMVVEAHPGLFPAEGLARYQWRKHGGCSGKSASAWFADVRQARAKVAIPEALRQPRSDGRLDAMEIERAFVAANPGLRTDMMAVACRRGVLQEVRICLTKDLRDFRTCPQVDRSGCRISDLRVPAIR